MCGGGSCRDGADLDEVVGEDAVSAPGSGAVDAGEVGSVPAVASFEVVDPSFGSGAPFDLVAEGSAMFKFAAAGAGFACARDRHGNDAQSVQIAFDRRKAVAAIGGYCARWAPGSAGDPLDRRRELRCVWRVSDLDAVVEDDSVGVVDDLGFIAELDRFAQPSFADRTSVDIVQADHPVRRASPLPIGYGSAPLPAGYAPPRCRGG